MDGWIDGWAGILLLLLLTLLPLADSCHASVAGLLPSGRSIGRDLSLSSVLRRGRASERIDASEAPSPSPALPGVRSTAPV